MGTNLFSLVGSILVDNSEANKNIESTDKKANTLADNFGKGVKAAGKFATEITALGAAAVTGITAMADSSASTLDVIDKASQRMNIGAESYQELAHAASLSGVEMSTLEKAAKQLEGTDLSMDDAIEQIYALGTAEERSAKAAELFGEAAAYKLSPMLNASAEDMAAMRQEAHDLGLVFDQETVNAGAKLNDTLSNIKDSLGAMKTALGNALIPVVQKFADKLIEFLPKVQKLFDRIAPVLEKMFDAIMPALFDLVDSLFPVIEEVFEALLPVFTEIAETVMPIVADLLAKLAPLLANLLKILMPIVQDVLKVILPIIKAIWPVISSILEVVTKLLEPVGTLLNVLLKPLFALLQPFLDMLQMISPILEVISGVLSPILDLINLILTPISDFINWIFGDVSDGVNEVSESLGEDGLTGSLGGVADFINGDFADAFGGIISFISAPLKALGAFFDWIEQKVADAKTLIEDVADFLGLIDKTDERSGVTFNVNRGGYLSNRVPRLAEGAVLQPNHPFAAIVGDQKSGVNVETPLSTIQEAVRNELENLQINVLFDVNNDLNKTYEIIKKRSWTERKRTGSVQMA